jgi:hypothetical protein
LNVLPRFTPGSTNLNSKITSYDTLAERILRQLGEPLVNVEISTEQLYDNIAIAMEYFTKYAGYTEEYLVFDSKLYVPGQGLAVDKLINSTPEMRSTNSEGLSGSYDYDLEAYRRVLDCFAFNYGETTGVNTLFTLENAMAQQIYSSYMIGNFGFDLVTWEALKGFIDTRNKVLALTPRFRFDPKSQMLRIIPEPRDSMTYLGLVGCYIERPIADIINERWINRYATALSKISVANVRGKISGVSLFGGGQINYQDFMTQGIAERDALELELKNNNEDVTPPGFFIGVLTALAVPAFLFAQNVASAFLA